MSQTNHNDCWISVGDLPRANRRVIIWTKKSWLPKLETVMAPNLDTGGAWYDRKQNVWYHSDGTVAKDVSHWMEIPKRPIS